MNDQHDLPGRQFIPSNSDEGNYFCMINCEHCSRDAFTNGTKELEDCEDSDFCPILAASFRNEAIQWRELDSGKLICTEFLPMEETP
jgi:MoaA/NifB/PqqE/SkfB family radical SAM enzyme